MLYLKTIYSQKYSQWFQFITISFVCLFLNPLLRLEVSLKLQLILKGNCLIKFVSGDYSECKDTAYKQHVPKQKAGRWCLHFLWFDIVLPSKIEGTILLPPPVPWWCSILCHIFAYVVKIFEEYGKDKRRKIYLNFKTRT